MARLSFHFDRQAWREAAVGAVRAYGRQIARYPRAFAKTLALYPNPATSQLTLRVAGARGAQVEILNALGQTVARSTVANDQTALSVAALPAGLYGVRLTTQEGTATRRFVKQ